MHVTAWDLITDTCSQPVNTDFNPSPCKNGDRRAYYLITHACSPKQGPQLYLFHMVCVCFFCFVLLGGSRQIGWLLKKGESFIIDFSSPFNENDIRKDWQDENATEENLGMYDKLSHKIICDFLSSHCEGT